MFCFIFLQIQDANFFLDAVVSSISVQFWLKYKQKVTIFVAHTYVAKKEDVLCFSLFRNAPNCCNFKPFCFLFLQIEDANFFVDAIVSCISVHLRLKYKQKVTIFVPHLYVAKKENVLYFSLLRNAPKCYNFKHFCFLFLQIEDANFFVDAAVRATGAGGSAAGTSCKSPSSVNSGGGGGGNATAAVVGGQAPTEVTSDVFVFPNVSVTAAAAEVSHQGVLACIVELTTPKTKNKCR